VVPYKDINAANRDGTLAQDSLSQAAEFRRDFQSKFKNGNGEHSAVYTEAPRLVSNGDGSVSIVSGMTAVSRRVESNKKTHPSGGTSSYHSDSQHARTVRIKETPHLDNLAQYGRHLPAHVQAEIGAAVSPALAQLQGHEQPQLTHFGGSGHYSPPASQSILLPAPQRKGATLEELPDEPENLSHSAVNAAPNRPDSTTSPAQAFSDKPIGIEALEDEPFESNKPSTRSSETSQYSVEDPDDESPPENANHGHHQTVPKAESSKPPTQSPETNDHSVEEPDEEPEHPQHTGPKGSTIERTNSNTKPQDPVGPPVGGRRPPVPPPPENVGVGVLPVPDKWMSIKQFEIMAQRRMGFTPKDFTKFQAELRKPFRHVASEAEKQARLSQLIPYTLSWLNKNVKDHGFKNQIQDPKQRAQVERVLRQRFLHMYVSISLCSRIPDLFSLCTENLTIHTQIQEPGRDACIPPPRGHP